MLILVIRGKSHLHSSFTKIQPHSEFLPREHVGVLRLVEGALQLVQLVRGERGAAAAHLLGQRAYRSMGAFIHKDRVNVRA